MTKEFIILALLSLGQKQLISAKIHTLGLKNIVLEQAETSSSLFWYLMI